MIPETELTDAHIAYWRGIDPDARVVIFTAPEDPPGCVPSPGVVTIEDGFTVVRVAWRPDEIDLAALARGGVLWLSCFGGLPAHEMRVQPPHEESR